MRARSRTACPGAAARCSLLGNKFEGDWVEGRIEGEGTFTFNDGYVHTGAYLKGCAKVRAP